MQVVEFTNLWCHFKGTCCSMVYVVNGSDDSLCLTDEPDGWMLLFRRFLFGSWMVCDWLVTCTMFDCLQLSLRRRMSALLHAFVCCVFLFIMSMLCWCAGNDNLPTSYPKNPANKPVDVLSVQDCLLCAVMLWYIQKNVVFVLEHCVNTDLWGATCLWYEAVLVLFDYCQYPCSKMW
jgi:hypothetical protein